MKARAHRDRLAAASGILSYFTRHATAANLILFVMIAAGLAAAPRMRAQYLPDVVSENISVTVAWPGAGANDVDRAVIQVLEPGLLAVDGVATVTSTAREGQARIGLEFEPGWDMSRASEDVDAAVDAASDLPEDTEDPVIARGGWRDRVTDVIITGPVAVEQLGRFADEMVARLYAAGVTRVTVQGLAAPEIVVELPSSATLRHHLTMRDVSAAIAAETAADPAGEVSGGAARVRTGVEKRSPEALAAIVLKTQSDGSTLTLGEVATIRTEGADRVRAMFVGANPALTLRVDRSEMGDAIGIQETVEKVAAEMRPTLPAGVVIDLIRTRSADITQRLDILLDNGAMGLVLVLGMLFLFLNARTALWVAAGIPVAMLAALASMYVAGLTINMISLFALIITLGIVVDDAIVVGEHADFRARHLGEAPFVASENAVRRMAAPVFSSTVTTVIAFAGLAAIGGHFGTLIRDIPFTVSAVLIASLVESFLILPNHMAHALTHVTEARWYDAPSRAFNRALDRFRAQVMRPLTRWIILLRYPVLAAAVFLLAQSAALYLRGDVTWRFFNSPERGSVTGNFAMLPGATREDSFDMMRQLQAAVDKVSADYEARDGIAPVTYSIAEIGANTGRVLAGSDTKDPSLLGSVSVELIDADLRDWSSFDFAADLQKAAPSHPLMEEISFRGWRQGPGGDALDVKLTGADSATLKAAAEALKTALTRFSEVSAVEDSLPYDTDELILDLTPQGQALGFTIDGLGRDLRDRLNGIEAATFPDGQRTSAIQVEIPEREQAADFLDNTMVTSPTGAEVPLADIVSVTVRSGFSTIRRENGTRVVSITGEIDENDPARAAEVIAALDTEILPRIAEDFGVGYDLAGLSEQEDEFLTDAVWGFLAGLAGIYAVLAWIFSSWSRPVVVMLMIPLGLVGALWGHWFWDLPISMFSVVGFIGMAGIIINDAIVLVSTVDEYAEGRSIPEAITDAVSDRLRPVVLTTATTVLGLAPLLFEGSKQAEFLKPTVVTLCYGLGFGLILVLCVVPALLAVQLDIRRHMQAARRALDRRAGALRILIAGTATAIGVLFTMTFGSAWVAGSGGGQALALFAAGSFACVVLAGVIALVTRSRRAQP